MELVRKRWIQKQMKKLFLTIFTAIVNACTCKMRYIIYKKESMIELFMYVFLASIISTRHHDHHDNQHPQLII